MPTSIVDCWKRIIRSELLTADQCQQLSAQFGRARAQRAAADAQALIQWLVDERRISRYQGDLLLAGKDGPFFCGPYKIIEHIEHGRLSGFFRGAHNSTHYPVMLQPAAGSREKRQQIESAAGAVRHQSIIHCFDSVSTDEGDFVVLEDLRGSSLAEWQQTHGGFSAADATRITAQLADALERLHAAGWSHGDLRTENIWRTPPGNVKIFLLADKLAPRERVGIAATTRAQPSRADDWQQLGCLMCELVTNRPTVVVPAQDTGQYRNLVAQLPPPLDEIAEQLLTPRGQMSQQAADLLRRLRSAAGPAEAETQEPPPLPTRAKYETWLEQKSSSPSRPRPPQHRAAAAVALVPDLPQIEQRVSVRPGAVRRKARRAGRRTPMWLGIGLAAISCLLLLAIASRPAPRRETPQPAIDFPPAATKVLPPRPVDEPAPDPALAVEDDGSRLWASPTRGEPPSLTHLPGGAQVLLLVRLSELLASDEGRRVLQAMRPQFQQLYDSWRQTLGVDPSEVESAAVGIYGSAGEPPRVSISVGLRKPHAARELLALWGDPQQNTAGFYEGTGWAYLLPVTARVRWFVMGHPQEIGEFVEAAARPTPLRREIARLVGVTDRDRHVNLVFAPPFLFGDGLPLFAGQPRELKSQLAMLLGDEMRASLLSLHFADEHFFLELVSQFDAGVDRTVAAEQLRRRLDHLPASVAAALARRPPPDYWHPLADRFPSMLEFLAAQTRLGDDRGMPVLNAALPSAAAHNLAAGTEMMLSQVRAGDLAPAAAATEHAGLPELLEQMLTVDFEQESLETALEQIGDEFRSRHGRRWSAPGLKILGGDLESEGITRNQQIREFRQEERTLSEILTALVLRANPTPADRPADPTQRVVWVIGPDPDDPGRQAVLITTRKMATKKYALPDVFQSD